MSDETQPNPYSLMAYTRVMKFAYGLLTRAQVLLQQGATAIAIEQEVQELIAAKEAARKLSLDELTEQAQADGMGY